MTKPGVGRARSSSFQNRKELIQNFFNNRRGCGGDKLHFEFPIVHLPDAIGNDEAADDANAAFCGQEAGGQLDFPGPPSGAAGDRAYQCHAGLSIVIQWAQDDRAVTLGHFMAGGGGEIHVDEVAAIGSVAAIAHRISLPTSLSRSSSRWALRPLLA